MSVYKTWVFYTLTYAQTVAAFLMARLAGDYQDQDSRLNCKSTKEEIKTKHQRALYWY